MPMTPRQLRAALKRLGLNQVALARAVGVTPRAVRFWLAGTYPVPEPVVRLVRTWLAHPDSRPTT